MDSYDFDASPTGSGIPDSNSGIGDDHYSVLVKDPTRKTKYSDPGWTYGFWPILSDKNQVQCGLCGHISKGGIKRLKEHLTGLGSNVIKCNKTNAEIKKQILDYMEKNRRKVRNLTEDLHLFPSGTEDDDNGEGFTQSNQRDDNIKLTSRATASTTKKPVAAERDPMDAHVSPLPRQVVALRKAGKEDKTIETAFKKEAAIRADKEIARWFYQAGVPFNAANSSQYEVMVEAISQAGSGYVPPKYHALRTRLLDDEYISTRELKDEHLSAWKKYGCTLMSDGWSDRRGRSLINFLVNSPHGTFFLYSVDVFAHNHTGELLFRLMSVAIGSIGPKYVIQVVTDNASNFVLAGKLLIEKWPHLFWTPCAAHCVDLMLEEISELPTYASVITKARKLTSFIYAHTQLHHAFLQHSNGKELTLVQ